jgi:hypothetical protein
MNIELVGTSYWEGFVAHTVIEPMVFPALTSTLSSKLRLLHLVICCITEQKTFKIYKMKNSNIYCIMNNF